MISPDSLAKPPLRWRFDRLTEQLDIITGMWATPIGQKFHYSGTEFTLIDSPALPKPVQRPHPPIIVGGFGAKRTPALAARFANEYNVALVPRDIVETQYGRVRRAVAAPGR